MNVASWIFGNQTKNCTVFLPSYRTEGRDKGKPFYLLASAFCLLPSDFFRRRWRILLLAGLTLLLTLVSVPSGAQTPSANNNDKAAVVVDGQVLFEVGNFGNFTAAERAQKINEALEEEVRSLQSVNIEIAQEDQQVMIRTGKKHLLTVTPEDVISAANPFSQAFDWKNQLQAKLQQGKLERTAVYYRRALIFSLGVLLGAIALHFGLGFGGQLAFRQLTRWLGEPTFPLHPWEKPAKLFLRLGLLGCLIGLWTGVIFIITDLFPQTRSWRYKLFNLLNSPFFNLGDEPYSAIQVLLLLGLTVGLWFAVSIFTRLFKSYVLVKTGAVAGVQEVIGTLMQYLLTFLGLIILLPIWGLDVGSLAIFASVLGLGIGFGVQNITNNLISGLIITLERPIQVGDFINVKDLVGTVERIGARSTEILTLDKVTIIVPNSRFLESEVINWSHGDPISRLRISVGVAYGSNIEQVQAALLEAANTHPDVLLTPPPQVWFQEFAESSLNFDLLVWTGEPKKQPRIKSDLNYLMVESLNRYQINVPFPQRDLNLRSPLLEEFLNSWLQLHSQPVASQGDEGGKHPQEILTIASGKSNYSPILLENELAKVNIEELVPVMRGSEGVEIKDRYYRRNLYPACFIGAEAVEWLMQKQNCSLEVAIALGELLITRKIIHHVTDQYSFRDDYLFYRFYADEQ
ncbi:MAG: mechanosensitive ion channel [Symploca sp. SIO2E6]|nr:mechanosensitive ion channel [Symploca sp. SIO2E6]